MPTKKDIGVRLKEAREKAGMSQAELAKLLGVSRQAVNNYETGDRKPADENKKKLADILDISIENCFFRN